MLRIHALLISFWFLSVVLLSASSLRPVRQEMFKQSSFSWIWIWLLTHTKCAYIWPCLTSFTESGGQGRQCREIGDMVWVSRRKQLQQATATPWREDSDLKRRPDPAKAGFPREMMDQSGDGWTRGCMRGFQREKVQLSAKAKKSTLWAQPKLCNLILLMPIYTHTH